MLEGLIGCYPFSRQEPCIPYSITLIWCKRLIIFFAILPKFNETSADMLLSSFATSRFAHLFILQNDEWHWTICRIVFSTVYNTAQKMKFSIKDFFSKCDQICKFLRIWSHLLKKYNGKPHFFAQCNVTSSVESSPWIENLLTPLFAFT